MVSGAISVVFSIGLRPKNIRIPFQVSAYPYITSVLAKIIVKIFGRIFRKARRTSPHAMAKLPFTQNKMPCAEKRSLCIKKTTHADPRLAIAATTIRVRMSMLFFLNSIA